MDEPMHVAVTDIIPDTVRLDFHRITMARSLPVGSSVARLVPTAADLTTNKTDPQAIGDRTARVLASCGWLRLLAVPAHRATCIPPFHEAI